MSIATLIKTIQDIMRKDVGVDGDAQRISQIVWLLFLKIFDDKEQEWQVIIPGELMQEYQEIVRQLTIAQNALKSELMHALGGKA